MIDKKEKKWVCIDAFKKRIKLEKCAYQILVQLSADAYREIKTNFELIKEKDKNEQNILFAMVRPIIYIIMLSLFWSSILSKARKANKKDKVSLSFCFSYSNAFMTVK